MFGLFASRHKSATIRCALQTTIGGTFEYAANRFRIEGRKKPPRQGDYSAGRSKHNPRCRQARNFLGWGTAAKKAPPSHCRWTQAAIHVDEKAVGGEKKKGFLNARPNLRCCNKEDVAT